MKNKDRQLMIMLFIQVSSITLLSLPVSVLRVYSISTMTIVKSIQRQQIEQFLGVLLNVLSLMITGSSFFLFTLTGTIFREELKRLIFKCLPMKYTNNATAVSKTRKQEAT
ncbi:unnamed protein product [Didymodactylos carnosus]|uniref:G-protein coupled receptors family 1 profile domain-containing protein n=1 Tax=Didymodactylos carnosus TaxID=1234261 RepID=A0A814FUT7_9BILA|nr:unnamed protein product [Didymodactylos carnosus]CAF1086409.1 unnamed protein product [Didymodactylos carnosus]CAF3757411.1 unnamed protein product [Didymodactylos carnosus]CAF3848811.1 unnamed protein product [Didymodactylos carnosus]